MTGNINYHGYLFTSTEVHQYNILTLFRLKGINEGGRRAAAAMVERGEKTVYGHQRFSLTLANKKYRAVTSSRLT